MTSTLHGVVARWAALKPHVAALISVERGTVVDWVTFEQVTSGLAGQLLRLGFRKGDFLAASLPFLVEHVLVEYACFRVGVIHAPLDPRLPPAEVLRCLNLIQPKGFAYLNRDLAATVKQQCASVEHMFDFTGGCPLRADLPPATDVQADDGAQVIFTTGSTGSPKPALLSHRNITSQNLCLGEAFGFGERTRLLVNLPPFHVGGQAEALMTALYWGGTAILMEGFDAARSLQAIQQHRVNIIGQIPAMFNYQWRLSDYASYDLSSLEIAIYGGQQVPRQFLQKLSRMAPRIASGLGLTEAAGFCTYTPVDDVFSSLGRDRPSYPMTIREPMREDGQAGGILPDGQVGHVCFQGPQTFLGYVNDPEAMARTVSRDAILYTGDMGFRDDKGLHFSGRAKWIIKPAGHQVFPGDVENHFCSLADKVAACAVVGVEHSLLSEAIVAFVEKRPGAILTTAELRRHAKGLASYMRPLHYILLEPGGMPLNRAAKSDYLRLQEMARTDARVNPR